MLYPLGAAERAMKVHEILMRALDGQLTWIQAAEILGRSPRPPPALCPLLLRLRMPNSGTAGKASWPS